MVPPANPHEKAGNGFFWLPKKIRPARCKSGLSHGLGKAALGSATETPFERGNLQRILILDPDCRRMVGHFYATTKSLLDELGGTRRFVAVNRKASPDLDFGEDVVVWKWPKTKTLPSLLSGLFMPTSHRRARRQSRSDRAMLQFARSANLREGDAIIVHSVWPEHAAGLASFAMALAEESAPHLHVRILGGRARSQQTIEQQNSLEMLAEAARTLPRLHIYTETAELATELEASYRFPPIKQWLTPMNIRKQEGLRGKPDLGNGFVIGLLGGKRAEQGAEKIPELIKALALRYQEAGVGRVRILCQKPASLDPTRNDRTEANRFMTLLPDLSRSPNFDVEFLDSELSAFQFQEAIHRSHVLLLPYDVERYGLRGSGMIIEAAISGTPVVVAEGFAMRDWQQFAGSPTARDIGDYVEAVFALRRDYQSFRERAIEAGRAMRDAMDERITEIRSTRSNDP